MKKTKVKMHKHLFLGMSILDISNTLMYEFWWVMFNQSMKTNQNHVIWILIALLFTLKLKIFVKTLLMVLKNDLTHLPMIKMIKDHLQLVKTKK